MYASVASYTLQGIHGRQVTVEVDVANGLQNFHLVGLPSTAVRESKDRVRAAIQNSGFTFPLGRITINLAPADLRKEGPALDLPICIGILMASGQIDPQKTNSCVFLGEIALDGSLLQVKGALSLIRAAAGERKKRVFISAANQVFREFVPDIEVVRVHSLQHCVAVLKGIAQAISVETGQFHDRTMQYPSIDQVKGQWQAKRAIVIAAAGGHHLLYSGPPGTGKTMLCHTVSRLLPELNQEERIELQQIYETLPTHPLEQVIIKRPFRTPHHSITPAGLLGGGGVLQPGEITLAHHGILFLDELLEFPRKLLDQLRLPLERKSILIARAGSHLEFPASFQLIAACNPCPCGFYGSPGFKACTCPPHLRASYQARASGPLLDRFDLRLYVPPLQAENTQSDSASSTSGEYSEQEAISAIAHAWKLQRYRNGVREDGHSMIRNADLAGPAIERCELSTQGNSFLNRLISTNLLSGRGRDAVIRVGRTIADLDTSSKIEPTHLAEAVQLRAELLHSPV